MHSLLFRSQTFTDRALVCFFVSVLASLGCQSPWRKTPANINGIQVAETTDKESHTATSFRNSRIQNPRRTTVDESATASLSDRDSEPMDGELESNDVFLAQTLAASKLRKGESYPDPDRMRAIRDRPQKMADGMEISATKASFDVAQRKSEDEAEEAVEQEAEPQVAELSDRGRSKTVASHASGRLTDEETVAHELPTNSKARPLAKADEGVSQDHLEKGDQPQVVPASHQSPLKTPPPKADAEEMEDTDWRIHLQRAIEAIQRQQKAFKPTPEIALNLQASERLMNLLLGDLDKAYVPIEDLQQHEQDYFREQVHALYDAFDPAGHPVMARRWSLALASLRKAESFLATGADLELKNLAFCTQVDGFGIVTRFAQNQFQPEQECLLYCEVDNFTTLQVKNGYETQLQGNYEIVESNGRRVAQGLLPMNTDLCNNQRRDYFIVYQLYMPSDISAGKYQLKLTIEDMHGKKFGQSSIDFRVAK